MLHHAPFRAGVEESQGIPNVQVSVPRHPHLHLVYIVLERRRAGVVHVEQVGVEIDVVAVGRLDCGPGTLFDVEMVRDGSEEGAGGEGDERAGVGLVMS